MYFFNYLPLLFLIANIESANACSANEIAFILSLGKYVEDDKMTKKSTDHEIF